MTAEDRNQKLANIAVQIGLRDVMIETAERDKRALLDQYRTLQQMPVDEPAKENTDGR